MTMAKLCHESRSLRQSQCAARYEASGYAGEIFHQLGYGEELDKGHDAWKCADVWMQCDCKVDEYGKVRLGDCVIPCGRRTRASINIYFWCVSSMDLGRRDVR
jgi:hypothetical protein